MADLGTISVHVHEPAKAFHGVGEFSAYSFPKHEIIPAFSSGIRGYSSLGTLLTANTTQSLRDGTISGTVKENGVPIPFVPLLLIHRLAEYDPVLARGWSGPDGTFSFTGLEKSEVYCVVALDLPGGVSYNAIIYDKLTPT